MTACMPGMKLFVTWVRGKKGNVGVARSEEDTIGGGAGRPRKVVRGAWEGALSSTVSSQDSRDAEEAGGVVDVRGNGRHAAVV